MGVAEVEGEENLLMQKIAKILDESKSSYATHNRKIKELSSLRRSQNNQFSSAFIKTLTPLFQIQRRTPSSERVIRFVSAFVSNRHDNNNAADSDDLFLEEFLNFLLVASGAANKTARFRACHVISEIIMLLPDDAEVSSELWDEVIECMKLRVGDKVPGIRTFAIRALARFVNDAENRDILDLLLEMLPLEQNTEVRKTIVLSLPPSNATSQSIIGCTLDVNESVRKAAYCVLAKKFPLQSISIKLRTIILQRGLADRSTAVSNECLNLMKDQWLANCCNGDPVKLLKYLDVETYESVAESVMRVLLKAGLVKMHSDHSIRDYIKFTGDKTEGDLDHGTSSIQLMEPEVALYWRTICNHLQIEAQAKGSDAAATMGTEAAVYAAEASDKNDLFEEILPETLSDYVDLVKAHIDAGPNYRFVTRQLLLLGSLLDFSDATIGKLAGAFVRELLHRPLEHEVDDHGNKVVIGDGINLGGDREWADAVSGLARKVHAAAGEFEEVVLRAVEELARPCRERTADILQWMHALALTGLLLENTKSFRSVQGKAIEPAEILQSLLLPGAKHVHLDVQRVAMRCLGLFGLLENKPSEELVKQLRLSYIKDPPPISVVACKALIDLGMWHGPQEVDRAMGQELSSHLREGNDIFDFSDYEGDPNFELLDLLYHGLDYAHHDEYLETEENESVQAVLGEGFAKILLLSESYRSIPDSILHLFLSKIISLYFSNDSKNLQRLQQCLSVFFGHYPSLSANHKKCLSKAFIPVMHSLWPGIAGNSGGSSFLVSNMRKRAIQASKFMLQMMQSPLYAKETDLKDENSSEGLQDTTCDPVQPPLECGEEGLAIRIAQEVMNFPAKKNAAEKAYVSALCKILVLLHFRVSEQGAIKLMMKLLSHVAASASADKELVKELKQMAVHLKGIDGHPDQELLHDQATSILRSLDLDINLDDKEPVPQLQTPAPCTVKRNRATARRSARNEDTSSDEENSPSSVQSTVPPVLGSINTRSQRASKTVAMSKLTANKNPRIDEDDDEEEEDSEVTSEADSESDDDAE